MSGSIKIIHQASHWGRFDAHLRDGRLEAIEPVQDDANPSKIIASVTGWLDPTYRIKQPMVRAGWLKNKGASDDGARGMDDFVPVSWDRALDLVSAEVDRVINQHGNAAIFAGSYGWASSGRVHHPATLLKRMLGILGGFTGHKDTYSIAAGPAILRHVLGDDGACGGRSTSLEMIAAHCETLVVFGAIAPRTAQIEAGGIMSHELETQLRKVKARGTKIIHISPRKDDLPDWLNAEWWPIRPNTDAALMLALGQELVAADLHDPEFLSEYCSGSEILLDYLSGADDALPKTAQWAADITGIDAAKIRTLAHRMAASRTHISVSWSLQRAQHGEQPFWAAIAVAAMLGQIGQPGCGVGFGYGSLGGVGTNNGIGAIGSVPNFGNPADSAIPVARIADMMLNPGARYSYQGQDYTYPDIRMVYWAGGNPFHHHQDLNRFDRAWARPETIVVQDIVWTATALRADIVLPAVSALERNDIAGGRRSGGVMAMQKVVEPLGDARSDYDIFSGLAERLGVGDSFTEGRDELSWIKHLYEKCRTQVPMAQGAVLPTFEEFWAKGAVQIASVEDTAHLADFRNDPDAHPLATESGRIVLGSRELKKLAYDDCFAHPAWIEPKEWLGKRRVQDDAVFHLISSQPEGKLHSQLDAAPVSMACKVNGREQVLLNPNSARALNIHNGQLVRLHNERGACLAYASLSENIVENVAILATGSWLTMRNGANSIELAGNPNVLTQDIPSSQYGQGCAAHSCLVTITSEMEPHPDPVSAYLTQMRDLTAYPNQIFEKTGETNDR
ncbi:MAG: molybdopterin-dependent oxidoreductase [Rhodobacteraceae bacterium]|nr:molybdopterin-dependent oxidoreductase [Paracoccaceae bacterium]